MERTIRVTGTGNVSIKPDITIIELQFRRVMPTYEETLKASTEDVMSARKALVIAGVDEKALKTTDFNVGANYEYYYDEKNNSRKRFNGYFYEQSLKVTFDVNNELLGKVLYQLSQLDVHSEFNIRYGIKDTEKVKNELLASAIKDSKTTAEIITKSAGLVLGDIIDINYSWLNIEFSSRPYALERPTMCCSSIDKGRFDIDIDPDDIEKSDNITVVYQIK